MNQNYFIKAHNVQKERCQKDGQAYFEVDTDYEEDLKMAYEWIDAQVKEKRSLKFNAEAFNPTN